MFVVVREKRTIFCRDPSWLSWINQSSLCRTIRTNEHNLEAVQRPLLEYCKQLKQPPIGLPWIYWALARFPAFRMLVLFYFAVPLQEYDSNVSLRQNSDFEFVDYGTAYDRLMSCRTLDGRTAGCTSYKIEDQPHLPSDIHVFVPESDIDDLPNPCPVAIYRFRLRR